MRRTVVVVGSSLVAILLVLGACAPAVTEEEKVATPPEKEVAPPEEEMVTEEEELTLTEEQQEEWVERGCLTVSTIEEASRLAGYQVAMPTFIPEGYLPGDFVLNQLGFPPQLGGEWGQARRAVEQQWTWPDDPKINILLIQHPGTDENVSGEPIEICGRPGGREFFEAGNGREYPLVVLDWRDGDMVYSLGGSMAGPLTEQILHKIACSVPEVPPAYPVQ